MIRRFVLVCGLGIAAPVCTYLLAACVGAIIPAFDIPTGDLIDDQVQIRLISGPIHYDILVPATQTTRAAFEFAEAAGVPVRAEGVEWIVIGWGAREFYTTAGTYGDLEFAAVLQAIVGDQSVMRLDVAGTLPVDLDTIDLMVSRAQFDQLITNVLAEFEIADGTPIALPNSGFTDTDAFFEARSQFNLWAPCNQWVSQQLGAVQVPVGAWTPTPYSLRFSLWWHQSG